MTCIISKPRNNKLSPDINVPYAGNIAIVSLGCAKNTVDAEIMLGNLVSKGFVPVADPSEAELIIVNTCAFLQSAVEEGIDQILAMAEFKKTGRCRKLVVAGCMVERYKSGLAKELPEVDAFINIDELLNISIESTTTKECFEEARRPYFLYDDKMPRVLSTGNHLAYVKIAEGCNRPCAYCIIPKIRGAYRSRDMESVLTEITVLAENGVKEIDLIAQDLTAYGSDIKEHEISIISLLENYSRLDLPDQFWLRLMYSYPAGISEELIKLIKDIPSVCNYLDLPLQHISHDILKSMHRPLGEKRTRELIADIKKWHPTISLRTTFIVGFPGERDEDVDALADFIKEGYFDHVGVFAYSQEEEAKSYSYPEQIEEKVKQERLSRLMGVQQDVMAKNLSAHVGSTQKVLIEGYHPETELLFVGRTEWQAPEVDGQIIINDIDDGVRARFSNRDYEQLNGLFGTVKVTDVKGYDLVATLVDF